MIKKILIANRGEIACRIIKTAKKMGLKTVAVYSSMDAKSMHVQQSDESYCIGYAPANDSYLNAEKIIAVAKMAKADAIHPGYGFLSENADFAKMCVVNDIIFIGPPEAAIIAMADKTKAKEIMQQANVPITPGYLGQKQDIQSLQKAALAIGLPVLIKATAGGGGKGMRLVKLESELIDAIEGAKREALKSFANDHVFIEKYISPARHIEVQVFTDQHGNGVHLFERDCSLQRRHQKVIEEAPAINLSQSMRATMTSTAVKAALAIGYVGAGTLEFLVDAHENFYFMEMNTRLQVEHPVTEMITGVDLVEWQIRIASGEKLPLSQADIKQNGHAIEARIYAENPEKGFTPSIGCLQNLVFAQSDKNIRVDTGVRAKDNISMYYDPMIAKLIVSAKDRSAALELMQAALDKTYVVGVHTNIEFLANLMQQPDIQNGLVSTQYIETHLEAIIKPKVISAVIVCAAAIVYQKYLTEQQNNNPWSSRNHWRLNQANDFPMSFRHDSEKLNITLHIGTNVYTVRWNENEYSCQWQQHSEHEFTLTMNTDSYNLVAFIYSHSLSIFHQQQQYEFLLQDAKQPHSNNTAEQNLLIAPMPGTVVEIAVKPGQIVKAGQKLMVLEAMKMEHTLYAPSDGVIGAILFAPGDALTEGMKLIEFSPASALS